MNKHNVNGANNSGFTLIEALIAMVVLSFGLLAIAQFQSKLVTGSAYNKARSEAIALAQEKLDQLRNYSTEPDQVGILKNTNTLTATDVFPDNVVNGTYPTTAETLTGVNATFSRQWVVSGTGDVRDVAVIVRWNDPHKGDQSVTLNTDMTWKNPRGTADLGDKGDNPVLPSPTGAATLGNGTYTGTIASDKLNGDDGTATLQNGNDTVLVDASDPNAQDHTILLTLHNACDTQSGVCTDFVKISGTVYIDTATSSISPNDIKVLASDAAYCATTSSETSDHGDYVHFDYTCYLGGGWYGNIGLLLTGNGVTDADRVCVGDPNASAIDGAEAWKRVQLAKRRVYRGMTYEIDSNGNAVLSNGDDIIHTVGIKDAAQLPDTTWSGHTNGHDYVVMRNSGSSVTKADCMEPLTRGDSGNGTIFAGVPTDFLCLNKDSVDDSVFNYLDFFDTTKYRGYNDCPYNPASPPSVRYIVSGTITGNQDLTGVNMMTSDGTDNCTVTLSGNNADYECNVYDWGSGWVGAVYLDNQSGLALTCDIDPAMFIWGTDAPLFSSTSAHDLTCWAPVELTIEGNIALDGTGHKLDTTTMETSDGDLCTMTLDPNGTAGTYSCIVMAPGNGSGWNGRITVTPPAGEISCDPSFRDYTSLTGNVGVAAGDDYACTLVNYPTTHVISGTLSGPSLDLTGISVSANDGSVCTAVDTVGGYSCTVTDTGAGWTGSISVNIPGSTPTACTVTQHDYTTAVSGDLSGEDFTCSSDGYVKVSGSLYLYDYTKITDFLIKMDGVACGIDSYPTTIPDTISYTCVTSSKISASSTWSGTVTATTSKVICTGTGTGSNAVSQTYSGIAPNTTQTWNVRVESNAPACP